MLPVMTPLDGIYGDSADRKLCRQSHRSNSVRGSDFEHVPFGKLVPRSHFSLEANPSTLSVHLVHIFQLGSGPEMFGVAAVSGRDAGVKDLLSFRDNLVVVNHPSHTVSANRKSLTEVSGAVAFRSSSRQPRPAPIRTGDSHLRPEPGFKLVGKDSIKLEGRDNLFSHQSSWLIVCHALGPAKDARALPF